MRSMSDPREFSEEAEQGDGKQHDRSIFIAAALLALRNRGAASALQWLTISSPILASTRTSVVEQVARLAHALYAHAPTDPGGTQRILDMLLIKGWHSRPQLHGPLLRIVKVLYQHTMVNEGLERLCHAIVQRAVGPCSLGQGAFSRRRFATFAYNTAIRALILNREFERALTMIIAIRLRQEHWSPPLTRLTYFMFVRRVHKHKRLDLVRKAQDHILAIAEDLKAIYRQTSGRPGINYDYTGRYSAWTDDLASLLISIGNPWSDVSFAQPPQTDSRDADHFLEDHSRNEEIERLLNADRLEEAREVIHRMILSFSETGWATACRPIAHYQSKLVEQTSSNGTLPVETPQDPELQDALAQEMRRNRGLWQFSYLWLLVKSGQFETALRNYLGAFAELSWLPHDAITRALGPQAGHLKHTGTATCHFANHLGYVVSVAMIGNIRMRHWLARGRQQSSKRIILRVNQFRLRELEYCYGTILSVLKGVPTGNATFETKQGLIHLNSRFFYPWLKTFAIHSTRSHSGEGSESPEPGKISELLDTLSIFQGLPRSIYPNRMSAAAYRVLQVVLDMQQLGVASDIYIHDKIFEILASDVHNCWPLLRHVAAKLGMIPSRRSIADPDLRGSYDINSYISVLRGLMSLDYWEGGSRAALPYVSQVSAWLAENTVEAQTQVEQSRSPDFVNEHESFQRDDGLHGSEQDVYITKAADTSAEQSRPFEYPVFDRMSLEENPDLQGLLSSFASLQEDQDRDRPNDDAPM